MTALLYLTVADDVSTWTKLGFTADGGAVHVGGVTFVCANTVGEGAKGITDWNLHDPEGVLPSSIDGIDTGTTKVRTSVESPVHPNGVTGIDHLVIRSPDLERTIGVLEDLDLPCRRRRDAGAYGSTTMKQAFFWLGSPSDPRDRIVLEVVGESEVDPATKDQPSSFFGIAFVCADLDATAAFFGDFAKPPIDAVQPGRRITSISSRAGSSVAIALMSPHV
jgi:catechol 2,3-dioxygenase-like lactoylglutathione lyase family enzyme